MILRPVFANENYDLGRWVSETGRWEFGLRSMLFGVRVSAGLVGGMSYDIDYCAGADPHRIALLRHLLHTILEGHPESVRPHQLLALLPTWERRPIHLDERCFSELVRLAGEAARARKVRQDAQDGAA
ncbi:hypothetical protein [Deinococcus rufus]|uniref:Uncharacterized protein n=1 Tax=Deinococcus rufus TaxID=2136097 RepID=A0ABV7Z7Y0_9DEIO